MTHLRLLARLGQALAVLRDPDAGLLLPLPEPVVDPRVDADRLVQDALAQGRADGERYLFDGWSFGRPDEPPDAVLEPEYVRSLRRRCESAIHEHRDRQRLTDARLADLYVCAHDAARGMRDARDRMAQAALGGRPGGGGAGRELPRPRGADPADHPRLPSLTDPVWEGETAAVGPVGRTLLVGFLVLVAFAVEHYVADAYLPATGSRWVTLAVTATIAALTVLAPLVSGRLFRHRHATGSDGALAGLTFVPLVPSLAIVVGFGLLAAHRFRSGGVDDGPGVTGAGASTTLGLTEGTLIVVFAVVLFLAGAMAYLLGLAAPHPFQQAYVHARRRRDRTMRLIVRWGTRINQDYRPMTTRPDAAVDAESWVEPHGPPAGAARADDREAAIRQAYLAAENAYYQGLIEAVADPTFTEAVMRRRRRAPGATPGPEAGTESAVR